MLHHGLWGSALSCSLSFQLYLLPFPVMLTFPCLELAKFIPTLSTLYLPFFLPLFSQILRWLDPFSSSRPQLKYHLHRQTFPLLLPFKVAVQLRDVLCDPGKTLNYFTPQLFLSAKINEIIYFVSCYIDARNWSNEKLNFFKHFT